MAPGDLTQGRRLPDVEQGQLPERDGPDDSYRGAYWRDSAGVWWCGVPKAGMGIGNLQLHTITEHEDGTITAHPSLLVSAGNGRQWHGYLERGVFREVA